MNGRMRIQAAFSLEGTPEIGAVIPYESIFIRDHWEALTDKPWWVRISPNNDTQFEWRCEIASKIGQDWFDLPSGIPVERQDNLSIIEQDGVAYLVDQRNDSRTMLTPPKISGWIGTENASVHPIDPPENPDEIDSWMEGWVVPGQGLNNGHPDLPHRILKDWGDNYFPMGYINGPLWSCYYMWGFEGLMMRIVDKPELVRYAVSRFTDSTLEEIRTYAGIGALGLWLEDCMTDMVSPYHFHTLNLDYLRVINEIAHSYNLRTFHYFCGDPTGKWDDLLDTGADALALEESKKGFVIDIGDIVERVNGRMVILGNLDAIRILEQADDTALEATIKLQLSAGRKNCNRFIMSLGSPVTPDTPVSRVQRYLELAHTLAASHFAAYVSS
jgi:hypothetical protein